MLIWLPLSLVLRNSRRNQESLWLVLKGCRWHLLGTVMSTGIVNTPETEKKKKKTGTEEDFGVVWYHKHEDIACVEFHLHLIAPGHEKPLIFNHEY